MTDINSQERLEQPINFPSKLDIFAGTVALGASEVGMNVHTSPTMNKALLAAAVLGAGRVMWSMFRAGAAEITAQQQPIKPNEQEFIEKVDAFGQE